MKKLIIAAALAATTGAVSAQTLPQAGFDNVIYSSRSDGYSKREDAAARTPEPDDFKIKLDVPEPLRSATGDIYTVTFDLPAKWLERNIYLTTEGGRNTHTVRVNGTYIGSARDSRLPSRFHITPAVAEGPNEIEISVLRDTDEPESATVGTERKPLETLALTATPRPGIDDFIVSAVPDSTFTHGILTVDIIVSNPYNYPEPVTVGYDVYSPENQLKYYDFREVTIGAGSRDTVRFEAPIYGALQRMWSAESPKLYELTLTTRRDGLITEYIPARIGFVQAEWNESGLRRNGKQVELKPVRYNAPADRKTAEADLKGIKKRGYNAVYPDYPQPEWFYDITDRVGLYVIDRANINSSMPAGKQVGGSLANAPQWKDEYLSRVEGMYYRTRNHPSVAAWSLGGRGGNGYNMYKAYQWLHAQDSIRPVVFPGAGGEWNDDFELPEAVDFKDLPPLTTRRRR